MARAVAIRFIDEVGIKEDYSEAAARSRRAMERCTRGDKAVAEVFLEKYPPFNERDPINLAWTRTTRSGVRSFGEALGIISRPKNVFSTPD